jgi:Heparinase II/III-like protein
LGNAMFSDRVEQKPDDAARWLLGDEKNWLIAHSSELPIDWQFPASGYYLFGARFGERDEIKGMVDSGALGYLGIAAHGHADALAIWLSIGGEECLVDPGTFSYGGEYRWRDYFRGTAAHNTIRIDGLDQSVSGGRFLWTRKAQARVDKVPSSPARFDFAGSHDGYLRLRDPLRHTRSITYDDTQTCLIVKDEVLGKATHEIEQFWHFAPNIQVQLTETGVVARGSRFELQMQFSPQDLALALIRGQEDPPLGWYSRGYGVKEPTTVLRARVTSSAVLIEVKIEVKFVSRVSSGA